MTDCVVSPGLIVYIEPVQLAVGVGILEIQTRHHLSFSAGRFHELTKSG